jgi:hypothetical protein
MHEQVWTAVAQKLGLTYAGLNTALQNGQTVEQLAQAQGLMLADLNQAANARVGFARLNRAPLLAITIQASNTLLHRPSNSHFEIRADLGGFIDGLT